MEQVTNNTPVNIIRLAKQVDDMAKEMVTKDFLQSEIKRIDTAINAHVDYTRRASTTETNRIDEILKSNADALRQANAEANESRASATRQTEEVAKTLRDVVEATRSANAKAQSELINPIIMRLNEIEQKQYESRGKSSLADPMLATLVAKMEAVALTLSKTEGKATVTDPMLTALNTKVDALTLVISNNEGKSLGSAHNIVTWSSVLTEWIKPIITAIATAILVYFVVTSGLAR